MCRSVGLCKIVRFTQDAPCPTCGEAGLAVVVGGDCVKCARSALVCGSPPKCA